MKLRYWAVVALQLGTLLAMAASRELRLASDRTVVLATVPVDPRDLFRGDYVRLRYEISDLAPPPGGEIPLGRTVWVPLHRAGDVWVAGLPRETPPDDAEPRIQGRVTNVVGGRLRIEYGIEQYFVPEGHGVEIERLPRNRLRVEVALDADGRAAIRRLLVDGKPVDFSTLPTG